MPPSAATPTTTSEVVTAGLGSRPTTYTSAGTARIEPPPPRAPRAIPSRIPSGRLNRSLTPPDLLHRRPSRSGAQLRPQPPLRHRGSRHRILIASVGP